MIDDLTTTQTYFDGTQFGVGVEDCGSEIVFQPYEEAAGDQHLPVVIEIYPEVIFIDGEFKARDISEAIDIAIELCSNKLGVTRGCLDPTGEWEETLLRELATDERELLPLHIPITRA